MQAPKRGPVCFAFSCLRFGLVWVRQVWGGFVGAPVCADASRDAPTGRRGLISGCDAMSSFEVTPEPDIVLTDDEMARLRAAMNAVLEKVPTK